MRGALTAAPWLGTLARVFDGAGAALYLVGGAVRNPLMGLPLSDVDVCGPERPERVMALCEGTPVTAVLRAAHFGTVELHCTDGEGRRVMAEYTTFREDSYRCGHKPEAVRFTTDIRVDALRRDFSVNALYRRLHEGALGPVIDPTGGLEHLRLGVLHTVTPDPDQVLKDDGLRVLRAARFQAELDLRPTEALKAGLTRRASLLSQIVRERLRDEWQKILMADLRYPELKRRSPASLSGLETLEAIGALPWLIPALPFDLKSAEALNRLEAPEGAPPLPLRTALLFNRAEAETVEAWMADYRFSQRDGAETLRLLQTVQAARQGGLNAVAAVKAGQAALRGAEAILAALGENEPASRLRALCTRLYQLNAPWDLRALAVHGNDLLPLLKARRQSPACLGALLNALWQAVLLEKLPNRREALLSAAESWLEQRP